MRIHLLENPSAGRGRGRRLVRAVGRALEDAGHEVTDVYGWYPGDLAEHVRGLGEDDVDRLVVAGGDGTLHSLLNARPTPPPWPIGMLPVGTANVIARETGVHPAFSTRKVVEAVLGFEPWTVDLLELRREGAHAEWAVLAVSVGFDAEVVHAVGRARAKQDAGATGGYLQWIGHVVEALATSALPSFTATVDARPAREGSLLIVQNARCYGGLFELSKQARLDSGRLDAVLVRAAGVRDVVRVLVAVGARRVARDRQVRILRGGRVRVRASSPVAVQADGDPFGHTDVEVVLRPGAFRLLRSPFAPR